MWHFLIKLGVYWAQFWLKMFFVLPLQSLNYLSWVFSGPHELIALPGHKVQEWHFTMCWYHQVQSCKQHISRTIWAACQADTHPFNIKEVPRFIENAGECKSLWGYHAQTNVWALTIFHQLQTYPQEGRCSSFLLGKGFLFPLLSNPPFPSSPNLTTNLCDIVHHTLKQEKTWSHQLMFLLCSEMILRYKYMFVPILAMLHRSKNQTDCTAGKAYLTVAVDI